MEITVQGVEDINSTLSFLAATRNQVPFATSKGINDLAADVQAGEVAEAQRSFIIRPNKWFLPGRPTGWNRSFAKKDTLEASVFTRAGFLPLQATGGTKSPKAAALSIPQRKGLGLGVTQDIAQAKRPRAIRGRRDVFSGTVNGVAGIFQRIGRDRVKLLYAYESTAQIKKAIDPHALAAAIIEAQWAERMETALVFALSTSI